MFWGDFLGSYGTGSNPGDDIICPRALGQGLDPLVDVSSAVNVSKGANQNRCIIVSCTIIRNVGNLVSIGFTNGTEQ